MAKMVFHRRGGQVACFVTDEGNAPDRPISIYPNAHDEQDSISICWNKSIEEAEQLAADILDAVKAIREELAKPKVKEGSPTT